MNFFQNIFSSKLSIITFIVFPIFLVLIVLAWIYMLFFSNTTSITQDQANNLNIESSSTLKIELSQSLPSSLPKSKTSKVSFDDLEKPKSAINSQSATISVTSPVASTPQLDVIEITTLLNKIQLLDNNNDDAALDNQILEN